MHKNKKTVPSGMRVALCGVLAALSASCMLMTFIPAGEYALPALAGMLLVPAVIELGVGAGWMSFAAAALVTLILPVSVEPKLLFVLFFGYYPVLKATAESRFPRLVELAIKLASFNAAMIASYSLLVFIFNFDMSVFEIAGISLPWLILLIGNAVFLVYDFALTRVITGYMAAIHPAVRKIFKL